MSPGSTDGGEGALERKADDDEHDLCMMYTLGHRNSSSVDDRNPARKSQ
jgi:hypothetical protein